MDFKITLQDLAILLNGKLIGDGSYIVTDVVRAEDYMPGGIVPFWEKKFISTIKSGSVLLTKSGMMPDGCTGVEVDMPRESLTILLEAIENSIKKKYTEFIHPTSTISTTAKIGNNVFVGPNCVIEDGAVLGDNCCVQGGVWIGAGTFVGNNCLIEPGVILYHDVKVGNNCIFHANCIIGCDGFGFQPDPKMGIRRIPQIGTVVIGNNVEIGCQSCVDRATFGQTKIGNGVKIDALVKVGHNAVIGDFSIIVAQSGIAGSSTIGRRVTMAAQSGVANHATIGDGSLVAGRAGVAGDIPAGSTVSGFPAQDHKKDMRVQATLRHLPELEKEVRRIKSIIEKSEK